MKPTRLLALALFVAAIAIVVGLFSRDRTHQRPAPASGAQAIERAEHSFLLVTVDTTRPDRLEPYGAENVETPTFAALARRGITFEHAYSTAPITLVAHTSILTGLYPPQHGVRNNGTHHVKPELETLAETLGERGWKTAAFVSAAVLDHRYGLDQGFDVYDDDLSTSRERFPRMVPDRPAEATIAAARDWLDTLGTDDKFFLWVHLYDPHAAYSPPPPFRDTYRDRLYDGEVAYMDAQLGKLFAHPRLELDETLTMVLGDHGESLGEHGEQTHAVLAYDSTLHVPWIVNIPGGPAGLRLPHVVDQIDLLPTVLDLLDQRPPPSDRPGRSLVPLFEGHTQLPQRDLYAETHLPYFTYGWAKLEVLRRGMFKYIDAPTEELYNLSRDPRELSNVAERQPGLTHDLGRDLGEMLEALGEGQSDEATLALDQEAVEQLRSLGYLAAGNAAASRPDSDRPDPKEVVGLHVGLERARHLIQDRLYEPAERQLRAVLDRDPQNLAALVDLGQALAAQDRIDDAITAVERALALDPSYARLHVMMASLERRRGEPEQALALLDTALGLDPNFFEAALQKAQILTQLDRRDDVFALLDELLANHPDEPRILTTHAQLIDLPSGELDQARQRLDQALERDPFLIMGWRLLGDLEERSGNLQPALDAWKNGLDRRTDDPDLHARIGTLLARRGDPAAEPHLREAIRLADDRRPELHIALGGVLAEQGRLSEAEAQYAVVLDDQPDNPAALNNRAIAYYRTGRVDQARADLERLTRRVPDYADAWNNLAAIAVEQSDWPTAERASRRALALIDVLPEAWNNLALSLAQQGEPKEAETAYQRALDLEPDYWQARFNLGILFADTDRHRQAAETLQAVIGIVPRFAEAHLRLGNLYADHLDEAHTARNHYNAFLRAAPSDPRGVAVKQKLAEMATATP
ncbi:MAG: tetratricopeptide repeat protein [Acidobacteriota bacterium]